MGRIPESKILEIKRANDIVHVIQEYVPLKRAGRGYVGRCPFHDDRKPSLQVSPDHQYFRCWVCDNVRGGVIDFLSLIENVDFRGALEMLAQRAGIPLVVEPEKPRAPGEVDREQLYAVLRWAKEQFQKALPGSEAEAYLQRREISSESVKRFELGYALEGWDHLLQAGVARWGSIRPLLQAGLVVDSERDDGSHRQWDTFRHRLMFPIHDARGRVLGFGARALAADERAKYINTPGTEVYHKEQVLFGLHLAKGPIRDSGQVLVMEGYTDVIAAHQFGFHNAVAVCGVALTERHLRELRIADQIVLLFDGDTAGVKSAEAKVPVLLDCQADARIVVLPEGRDPDDFLKAHGAEAFRNILRTGVSPIEFKKRLMQQRYDLRDAAQRRHASDEFLELLGRIDTEHVRAALATDVAGFLALDEIEFRKTLRKLMGRREQRGGLAARTEHARPGLAAGRPSDGSSGLQGRDVVAPANVPLREPDDLEMTVAACAIAAPEYLPQIRDSFEIEFFAAGPLRRIVAKLYGSEGAGVPPAQVGTDDGSRAGETPAQRLTISDLRAMLDAEAQAMLEHLIARKDLADLLFASAATSAEPGTAEDDAAVANKRRQLFNFEDTIRQCRDRRLEREFKREKAQIRSTIATSTTSAANAPAEPAGVAAASPSMADGSVPPAKGALSAEARERLLEQIRRDREIHRLRR